MDYTLLFDRVQFRCPEDVIRSILNGYQEEMTMSDLNRSIAPSDASTVSSPLRMLYSWRTSMVMRLQLLFQQLPPACAAPVGTSPVCAAPAGASPKDISSAASSSLFPSEYGHPHTIFLWPTIFQKIQPFHLVRPQPRGDIRCPLFSAPSPGVF